MVARRFWTNARLVLALLASWTLLSTAFPQTSSATSAEPGAYEVEVWRAAAKLDTREAYEAYLKRFPNGGFADMARLALAKGSRANDASPTTSSPDQAVDLGQLARIVRDPETGAIGFGVANRFVGPGVVTVGWFGAKRQIIIPRGDWFVLAAFDHPLQSNGISLQMTTIVLGNFPSSILHSLLVVTFNSRSIPPAGAVAMNPTLYLGMVPRWPAADACERQEDGDLFHALDPSPKLRACAVVRRPTGRGDALAFAPGAAERVDTILATVKSHRPTFALRSDLHFTEANRAYLGYVRLDAAPGGAADAAQWAQQRVQWLREALSPLATKAYFRSINSDDLEPGKASASPLSELTL